MIDRNVVALLERQSIQFVGREKHAVLEDVVQLEVRHDLRFVEIVSRLAHLLGVVLPVPRLKLEVSPLGIDQLLHVGRLDARARRRRRRQIGQQLDRVLGRLRALSFECVRRPRRISEQLRLLGAQLRHAADGAASIVAVAPLGAQ